MLVTLFTDASWCPETKVGGWGVWVKSNRGVRQAHGAFKNPPASSNEAEFLAAVNGIFFALKSGIAQNDDTILIQSDCIRVVEIFNSKLTRFSEIEKTALDLLRKWRDTHKITIKSRHVKAHTSNKNKKPRSWVNNTCDRLAKKSMRAVKKSR